MNILDLSTLKLLLKTRRLLLSRRWYATYQSQISKGSIIIVIRQEHFYSATTQNCVDVDHGEAGWDGGADGLPLHRLFQHPAPRHHGEAGSRPPGPQLLRPEGKTIIEMTNFNGFCRWNVTLIRIRNDSRHQMRK